jgi:radical SAM superfamily enzyme YgiQ (UPF0313 family)
MVGFPTENLQDMEEFCELIEHLVQIGRAHSKGIQIAVSIGIFIPKAFTPLQWSPFVDKETALSHIRFVRERFFRHPNVKINWSAWETSVLEAFYSRGDRSISKLIYQAYKKGACFLKATTITVNYEAWEHSGKNSNTTILVILKLEILMKYSHGTSFTLAFQKTI